MRLLLVRHPRPAIDAGLCYGSTDVAAAPGEILRVCEALRTGGLPPALPTWSSPLSRCADLARAIAPPDLQFDTRLAEMDFGDWEMRSWDAIPRGEVDTWAADLLHYRPGGGECVLHVARRVSAFLGDLYATGHPEALVICHAGTIRLLRALWTGQPLEAAALEAARTPHRIAYGEVLLLKN
ncbi:histidine phosphatase family protein [Massilia sp. SYSU DXS3249]